MSLVEAVSIASVADLYVQYSRFARVYELANNPLKGLTDHIPATATYYTVVPETKMDIAEAVMTKLAGRKKLRHVRVTKNEIKHPAFEPTNHMVIFYA